MVVAEEAAGRHVVEEEEEGVFESWVPPGRVLEDWAAGAVFVHAC